MAEDKKAVATPANDLASEAPQVSKDKKQETEAVAAPKAETLPEPAAVELPVTSTVAEQVAEQVAEPVAAAPVVEAIAATPAPAEPEQTKKSVPETPAEVVPQVAQQSATPAGLTSEGRALNDPRVEAKPVEVVEIVTAHPPLFGDLVAPPAATSGRMAPRAINDPRGTTPLAEASGQS